MSKKKNRFREWLSDNLRYIILGFSMLVILALLYIGFVFLVSLVAGTELKDAQSIQNQQESELLDDLDENNSGADNWNENGTQVTDESVVGENNSDENNSDENNSDENNSDENNSDENGTEADGENSSSEN